MAAKVNVCNVVVLDNPSSFSNPFQFEITFECFENLEDDLEWKLTYVGSAESDKHDQMLDSVLVGPIPEGRHMFVFQAQGADAKKIPPHEAMGVTVILLSCAYRNQEFIKIGYFVQNEYEEEELRENPPDVPQFDKLKRKIVAEEPRVTRFQIKWTDETETESSADSGTTENSNDQTDLVAPQGIIPKLRQILQHHLSKFSLAPDPCAVQRTKTDDDSMSSPPKKMSAQGEIVNVPVSGGGGSLEEMREKAKALNSGSAPGPQAEVAATNGVAQDVNMN